LAAATLIFALPQITTGLKDLINGAQGIDPSDAVASLDRIENDFFKHAVFSGLDPTISRGAVDTLGFGFYQIEASIKDFDEAVAGMVGSGDVSEATALISEFVRVSGLSNKEEALKWLPSTQTALTDTAAAAGETTEGLAALQDMEELAARATEELATRLGLVPEQLEAISGGIVSGLSSFGSISSIFGSVQDAQRTWAESVAESTSSADDSWTDYYDGITVTFDQFVKELETQVAAQAAFATNLAILVGKGAGEFAAGLAGMGEAGAILAAEAVTKSDAELQKAEALFTQRGEESLTAYVQGLLATEGLRIAAARMGDEASAELEAALVEGGPKLQAVINKWGLEAPIGANTNPATAQLRSWLAAVNQGAYGTARVRVSGVNSEGGMTKAAGGYISGPGTGTSDSIPARLSNGEYVIRASAVRKYGSGMFDQLNRGVAKFASGGPVGNGGSSFPSSMVTEFGPQSMAAVRNSGGGVTVVLDDVAIARASNRGNAQLTGGNRR
jgi:hypothetical protein